ncbi:menaquinone biosynthesis protein [Halalkalibacter hemicellulosilyticus]|uniref:Chorismate dehydratase n=1 Tax=Halalkalibacter hemicellulosilyticusJCM 9152 TaxID=1236971 RepID=W4QBH2_9BACI|nr:menaquinone biosynthesis protein [Halalkalibacter hemicellulosilyticus]GAE29013.1 menaquinone via futalosine step 1 [Halalkalibacter hemicellulosilyticusJCM 9152]
MSLTIGEISYTNILPFFYYLDRNELERNDYQFVPQVPSQLNDAMANGKVDIGGISSFAYANNQHSFSLLPDLSVTTYGKVRSIFLFSKYPIDQLDNKKIALTSSSETSVHLLKIILGYFYHKHVTYEIVQPHFHHMINRYDGCLLIGDDAIVANRQLAKDLYVYDLGEIWYEQTGLPMTYAVFAVRNKCIEAKPNEVLSFYKALLASKKRSENDQYRPMIKDILLTHGGTQPFWEKYFKQLCNDFGQKEQEGLRFYYHLLYKLGYLREPVDHLHVWNPVLQL